MTCRGQRSAAAQIALKPRGAASLPRSSGPAAPKNATRPRADTDKLRNKSIQHTNT